MYLLVLGEIGSVTVATPSNINVSCNVKYKSNDSLDVDRPLHGVAAAGGYGWGYAYTIHTYMPVFVRINRIAALLKHNAGSPLTLI